MREIIAEIYEMLATREPAQTQEQQNKQKEYMERARQVRLNDQTASSGLYAHNSFVKNRGRI